MLLFWNSAFWWTRTLNTVWVCKRKRSSVSILTKNGEWEFIPGPPSAAACFPARVNARSSSLWQLADSPVPAPRIHPGCHESNTERARYKAKCCILTEYIVRSYEIYWEKLNFCPIYKSWNLLVCFFEGLFSAWTLLLAALSLWTASGLRSVAQSAPVQSSHRVQTKTSLKCHTGMCNTSY